MSIIFYKLQALLLVSATVYNGLYYSFFFNIFFLMCTILLNSLQYCFCFMFGFFGHQANGILTPRPGIEPALPAL